MADISKCTGVDCPVRDSCYRFTASNEVWQSYLNRIYNHRDKECEGYYPNQRPCKHIKRVGESCRLNNNCKFPNCNE